MDQGSSIAKCRGAGEPLRVSRFRPEQAVDVAGWQYPPPYDMYSSTEALFGRLLVDEGDGLGYFVLTLLGSDEALGFCCYGPEARVINEPEPLPGTLDVGGGLRPDAVGRGIASRYMPSVLEHAARLHHPKWFRVAVAAFNERSVALCTTSGFVRSSSFAGPDEREFLELYRTRVSFQ